MHIFEDSSVYQEIVQIGEQKGKRIGEIEGSLSEARNLITLQGGIRYQPAPAPIIDKLQAMKSKTDLENLAIKLLSANSWEELFDRIDY